MMKNILIFSEQIMKPGGGWQNPNLKYEADISVCNLVFKTNVLHEC